MVRRYTLMCKRKANNYTDFVAKYSTRHVALNTDTAFHNAQTDTISDLLTELHTSSEAILWLVTSALLSASFSLQVRL